MINGGFRVVKGGWEAPRGFMSRKCEFTEYPLVNAQYDRQQRMGKVYWAVSGDTVVGYMTLAMGSAGMEKQEDLGIDTYGPVPGLTIARLATDERYERRGVGRLMVSYACTLARIMASDSGCRVVLANSELDAVEFYEKMGFVKFKPRSPSAPSGFWHWLCRRMDSKGMEENEYVPMYFDIGPEA